MTMNVQLCLRCPICCENFDEPKQLSCGHSFCRCCLDQIRQLYSISCPVCRKPTYLSMTGPQGIRLLPTNYSLIQIIEAIQFKDENDGTPILQKSIKTDPDSSTTTPSSEIVDKLPFKCGNCSTPVPTNNLWICGDCDESVFCAPCIITKHKYHRKCMQMSAISAEWHTACYQFDQLSVRIEKCIELCLKIEDGFACTKSLINRTDAEIEELKRTHDELSKIYAKARTLRTAENDLKQLHHFENLLKQLDFYANRLSLVLPALNEHVKDVNENLHLIGGDAKHVTWSNLFNKCQTGAHDSVNVLFYWNEPSSSVVSLAASFTNWKPTIQLVPRNGEHLATVDLPKGRHEFKFWVDGQWRLGQDWQTCKDGEDNLNNFLIV